MHEQAQPTVLPSIIAGIVSFLAAYFLIFGLIVLDELILKTRFIETTIPLGDDGKDFVRTIYTPLLWLLSLL